MRHYFTSDLHFFHANILKFSRPEFFNSHEKAMFDNKEEFTTSTDSIAKMNSYLIDRLNETVQSDDILWILGDWCFGTKSNPDRLIALKERIVCQNLYLTFGNHDYRDVLPPYFTRTSEMFLLNINKENQTFALDDDARKKKHGQRIVLSHYALATWENQHKRNWNLYGHSHSNAEESLNKLFPERLSIDVGVDNAKKILGEYRPFSFDELYYIFKNKKGHVVDHHGEKE